MRFPTSTGQVARLLGMTEPRLNDLIRRQKIRAAPILAGRRLWTQADVERAADALGLSVILTNRISEERSPEPAPQDRNPGEFS